jgi:hypothetical protein
MKKMIIAAIVLMALVMTVSAICDPTVCDAECVLPFNGSMFNTWVYGTDNATYSDCAGQLNNTHSDYNWAGVSGVDLNCDLSYSPGGLAENATLAANPSLCAFVYADPETIGVTCPSYDRMGHPITEVDCFCYNTTTWATADCAEAGIALSMLNFNDTFFTEAGGFATTTTTTSTSTTTTTSTTSTTTTTSPTTTTIASGGGGGGTFVSEETSTTQTTVPQTNQVTGDATAIGGTSLIVGIAAIAFIAVRFGGKKKG